MNTEITQCPDKTVTRGWIFYDAACSQCVRGRQRTGRLFESRGFEWLPLQTPGAAARLGVPELAFEIRMHLLSPDGRVFNNADALGVLCRSVWWLWPIGALLLVPGARELGRLTYDWFARNRYCFGGACRVEPQARGQVGLLDYVIAGLISTLAAFICWKQPAWLFMWALAFGMGFALKWLTWRDALIHGACPSARRAFAWFVLWPGLDGRAFLANDNAPNQPELREWLWAAGMTTTGAVLLWVVVPLCWSKSSTLAAWAGMVGIVLILHFGVIRFLSILFRRAGINAAPIMNAPFRATSLAEFWGVRWNTAFSIPARRLVLLPLTRQVGLLAAAFFVFVLSGLLHEAVISVPARAGFGFPTLYFLLQAAGVALERSWIGRNCGLGEGIRGKLFVVLVTAGPLGLLFHTAFAQRVIVPFLHLLTSS